MSTSNGAADEARGTAYEEDRLALMRALRPFDCPALRMVRIGRDCDGGYVVPMNVIAQAEACVSYGVGDDISFETCLKETCPNLPIFLFDHTIARLPGRVAGLTFVREGVCGTDTHWIRDARGQIKGFRVRARSLSLKRKWPFVVSDRRASLTTHLRRLRLLRRPVFLKMDVNGCEYEALETMPESVWRNIVALVIELHDLGTPATIHRALDCLARLRETHVLVHMHGNNFSPMVHTAGGLSYPTVVELTFVNERFVPRRSLSVARLPSVLDRPCKPGYADADLSFISSPLLAEA